MSKYRNDLPQLYDKIYLTDGGLEAVFVFRHGIDLPLFASFVLLEKNDTYELLKKYYQDYISIAKKYELGFILESPTWRASSKWGKLLNYSDDDLEKINRKAMKLMDDIRETEETDKTKIVISCCIGPHGDGYVVNEKMSAENAEKYHATQIRIIADTKADLITAMTITYIEEALGIVRAAISSNIPVVIGFTVETDGFLPSGQTIKDAIETIDTKTDNYTSYYMINCAHPTHFQSILSSNETWRDRIRAVRANASTKSHAELEECTELDDGNPTELGQRHKELKTSLHNLNIFGGCCGTDHRHVEAIYKAMISN